MKIEFNPQRAMYWEHQKITLPQIDSTASEWEMSEEEFQKIKSQEGKEVYIESVEIDVDGKAEHAYYNILTSEGYRFHMNFDILPIEMAMKLGFAGFGPFGQQLSLRTHPHRYF